MVARTTVLLAEFYVISDNTIIVTQRIIKKLPIEANFRLTNCKSTLAKPPPYTLANLVVDVEASIGGRGSGAQCQG